MVFPVFVTSVDFSEGCIHFWGQKDTNEVNKIQQQLFCISSVLIDSPVPTITDLKEAGCFGVHSIDGTWVRARLVEEESANNEPVNVFCVDLGMEKQVLETYSNVVSLILTFLCVIQVPINSLRLFPKCFTELMKPPMAVEFIMGNLALQDVEFKGIFIIYLIKFAKCF